MQLHTNFLISTFIWRNVSKPRAYIGFNYTSFFSWKFKHERNYCTSSRYKTSEIEKKNLNQKSISSGAKFNKPPKTGLHFYYFGNKKNNFFTKLGFIHHSIKEFPIKIFFRHCGKTKKAKILQKIGNIYLLVQDIEMIYIQFIEIIAKKFLRSWFFFLFIKSWFSYQIIGKNSKYFMHYIISNITLFLYWLLFLKCENEFLYLFVFKS